MIASDLLVLAARFENDRVPIAVTGVDMIAGVQQAGPHRPVAQVQTTRVDGLAGRGVEYAENASGGDTVDQAVVDDR